MIRLLARLAAAHSDPRMDFVGHVGGDDFLILFQSADWQQRCERIVQEFREQARNLYDEAALSAGGIHAEDRQGVMRFFPFTSVSVGAVRACRGSFRDADDVATHAAHAKRMAKAADSGIFILDATPAQAPA
jgi:GGDEF domain-containing protein